MAGAVSLNLQFLSSVENKLCRSEKTPSKFFCSAFFLPYPSPGVSLGSFVGTGSSARDALGGSWSVCLVCAWLWLLKSCCHRSPLVQGRGFGSPRARGQILALPVLAPDPDFPLQPFPLQKRGSPAHTDSP